MNFFASLVLIVHKQTDFFHESCKFCDRVFKGNLLRHVQGNLQRHMKMVHPKDLFQCPIPNCRRSYRRSDGVWKHIREYHKVDPAPFQTRRRTPEYHSSTNSFNKDIESPSEHNTPPSLKDVPLASDDQTPEKCVDVEREKESSRALANEVIELLESRNVLNDASQIIHFLQWLEHITADANSRL